MAQRPLKQCHKLGCTNLTREKYCDDHEHLLKEETYKRNRYYDRYERDQEAKSFYNSAAWLRVRERALIRDRYLCQRCLRDKRITPADMVHHIIPIRKDWKLRLTLSNCESICHSCHNKINHEEL